VAALDREHTRAAAQALSALERLPPKSDPAALAARLALLEALLVDPRSGGSAAAALEAHAAEYLSKVGMRVLRAPAAGRAKEVRALQAPRVATVQRALELAAEREGAGEDLTRAAGRVRDACKALRVLARPPLGAWSRQGSFQALQQQASACKEAPLTVAGLCSQGLFQAAVQQQQASPCKDAPAAEAAGKSEVAVRGACPGSAGDNLRAPLTVSGLCSVEGVALTVAMLCSAEGVAAPASDENSPAASCSSEAGQGDPPVSPQGTRNQRSSEGIQGGQVEGSQGGQVDSQGSGVKGMTGCWRAEDGGGIPAGGLNGGRASEPHGQGARLLSPPPSLSLVDVPEPTRSPAVSCLPEAAERDGQGQWGEGGLRRHRLHDQEMVHQILGEREGESAVPGEDLGNCGGPVPEAAERDREGESAVPGDGLGSCGGPGDIDGVGSGSADPSVLVVHNTGGGADVHTAGGGADVHTARGASLVHNTGGGASLVHNTGGVADVHNTGGGVRSERECELDELDLSIAEHRRKLVAERERLLQRRTSRERIINSADQALGGQKGHPSQAAAVAGHAFAATAGPGCAGHAQHDMAVGGQPGRPKARACHARVEPPPVLRRAEEPRGLELQSIPATPPGGGYPHTPASGASALVQRLSLARDTTTRPTSPDSPLRTDALPVFSAHAGKVLAAVQGALRPGTCRVEPLTAAALEEAMGVD